MDAMKPAVSLSGLDDGDIAEVVHHAARFVEDLRGARVLVTGATGWFGTWLLDVLVALDAAYALDLRLVAVSRDADGFAGRHPRLAAASPIEWIRGDVRDATLAIAGPLSHVVHAAAESSTTLSTESEAAMRETIVAGTRNVLSIARRARARRVLFVSSGAVYGPQGEHVERLAENAPCAGSTAYAASKREAERMVVGAADARCATVIARCFAFVGPHMPFDGHFAIGNFIRDAMREDEIVVRGDGVPRRSFLYMTDLVTWLLTMLSTAPSGGIFNVGSPDALSIAELARLCSAAQRDRTGREPGVRVERAVAGGSSYVPCVALAATTVGVRVTTPLDEAIARTMRWRHRSEHGSVDFSAMTRTAGVSLQENHR